MEMRGEDYEWLLLFAGLGLPPPLQEKIRAEDYEVRPIKGQGTTWAEAREFIAEHHYSGGCSKTAVYVHGLYRVGSTELLGVAMWLPPTRVAAESVNKDQWRKVLSLSRLVVHPDVPGNAATFLMARSIRLIRQDARFVSLVTYADEFMDHTGAIYKASNWTYAGTGQPQPRWEDKTGRQVSNRSTTTKTNAQMRERGYNFVGRYRKHKFVMHLKIQRKGGRRPIVFENDNWLLWFAIAV